MLNGCFVIKVSLTITTGHKNKVSRADEKIFQTEVSTHYFEIYKTWPTALKKELSDSQTSIYESQVHIFCIEYEPHMAKLKELKMFLAQ